MEKPSAYIHKHNHTQENIRKIIKYYSKSLKTTINIIKTNDITKKKITKLGKNLTKFTRKTEHLFQIIQCHRG